MIEIKSNLFIGNERDYELTVKHQAGWKVIHACKEPYHRRALGYSGRAVANNHPEYLIARRDNNNRLILNLVDVPDPKYISKEIIDAAIEFIHSSLKCNYQVLVHCNQGYSRSAGIGLLYLACIGDISIEKFIDAEREFMTIYPPYNPAMGMKGFIQEYWNIYAGSLIEK
jgi:hypothetical protein